MPQAFDNPFSGLNRGLQSGLQMGLQIRQLRVAEQELARKKLAEEAKIKRDTAIKGLETGQSLMGIKHPAIRQQGLDITMKTLRDNADIFGVDPAALPETVKWTDSFDPVVKEINEGLKAYKEGRIDNATAMSALNSSLMKARQIMESEDVEALRKGKEAELQSIKGAQESGMLQQAAMIPGLADKGVLTPEQAETGRLTALAGAGTEGQDILASLAEGGGKLIERTVDLGDKVEFIYTDGTRETKPKGMSPGANIQDRRLSLMEEKQARAEESAAKKDKARIDIAIGRANLVTSKIDKALGQIGMTTTGWAGSILSRVPGSSAYDLDKTIDTIKANIGFQELSDMRQASPTGGALGQIAVRELEFLQAALGSLEQGQSKGQLVETLTAIKTHYENWKNTVKNSKESGFNNDISSISKLPEGSKLIGTSGGKNVYQTPDGKKFVED